jgi:hypothetical protein
LSASKRRNANTTNLTSSLLGAFTPEEFKDSVRKSVTR